MSQRNPMNEKYTTDKKSGGSSRKSAASVKPKTSAGVSVIQGTKKKSKKADQDKRSKKRQERDRQYAAEKKYGDPPWKKFKIMKRVWIVLLVCSVATVALSFAAGKFEGLPEWVSMVFLVAAYVFIILTLYIDLGQIRKMRKQWASIMSSSKTKEGRAEQKKKKAQIEAAKKAEVQKAKLNKSNASDSNTKHSKEDANLKYADKNFSYKLKKFFQLKSK